jgi:hypothetical protein
VSTRGKQKRRLQNRYYQIVVRGPLDPSWSEWFNGLKLTIGIDKNGMPITRLSGTLPDQGSLRGVLNKLWDLNITLLSMECKN